MLTNEMSNTAKMVKYLGECKGMGISVSPPDINSSGLYFQAAVDRIQFGLVAIRNVGEGAIKSILATRRQVGGFRSFFHFCETVDLRAVNKRVLESLIKAGAFDSLGYRRKSLVESLDKALEQGQKAHRDRLTGQQGLFTGLLAQASQEFHTSDVADAGEWSDRQKWAYEKESVGYYLTGHPLQEYQLELQRFSQVPVEGIGEELAGHEVSVGGVVTELQKRTNRKGEAMASFVLEDLTGTVEVMVWPSSFEKYQDLLVTDAPILVKGRCEFSGKGELQILCSVIRRFDSVWDEEVQRARLLIPLARLNPDRIARLGQVLEQHRGSCSVEFELIGEANRVHVVPAQTILVNPRPEFIRDVEELFGEKCVSLYT
jgi:DNA polymerase-3 subunit alpha